MAESFRQDMPPRGGYESITWERIPLKKPFSGLKIFTVWALVTAGSFYVYGHADRLKRRNRRENEEVYVALEPLLMAERDRMNKKVLRSKIFIQNWLKRLVIGCCCSSLDDIEDSVDERRNIISQEANYAREKKQLDTPCGKEYYKREDFYEIQRTCDLCCDFPKLITPHMSKVSAWLNRYANVEQKRPSEKSSVCMDNGVKLVKCHSAPELRSSVFLRHIMTKEGGDPICLND